MTSRAQGTIENARGSAGEWLIAVQPSAAQTPNVRGNRNASKGFADVAWRSPDVSIFYHRERSRGLRSLCSGRPSSPSPGANSLARSGAGRTDCARRIIAPTHGGTPVRIRTP